MKLSSVLRLIAGLFVYAFGIVVTIQADLGLTPWNTFHQGIALHTGITLGQAISGVGLIIILFNILMKENVGLGTVMNMWLIGTFVDMISRTGIIPKSQSLMTGIPMLIVGMFIIAIASWLYIGSGLGAGPRDGMMVSLVKITGKPVGAVRGSIEVIVLIIGFLLGGKIGIGTPIMAFLIGPIVQITFKAVGFDVKSVTHKYITMPSRA